jgi:hypothetical protein
MYKVDENIMFTLEKSQEFISTPHSSFVAMVSFLPGTTSSGKYANIV